MTKNSLAWTARLSAFAVSSRGTATSSALALLGFGAAIAAAKFHNQLAPVAEWFLIIVGAAFAIISTAFAVLRISTFRVNQFVNLLTSAIFRVGSKQQEEPEPPILAGFLVEVFAKKRYRNGLRLSFDEDFRNNLAKGMSLRRARWLYWAAALNSVGPQLWAAIKRIGIIGLLIR